MTTNYIRSIAVAGLLAIGGIGPASACGIVSCAIGDTIGRGTWAVGKAISQDTGKTLEKSAQDAGKAIEKGLRDTNGAMGDTGNRIAKSPGLEDRARGLILIDARRHQM
jgi:hypothetical protein